MKTIVTFAGWVLVGVIVAFTGRQLWQTWSSKNPEKAQVIEKHVKETVSTSETKIKEVADKAMDTAANKLHEHLVKSKPEPPVEPQTDPKPIIEDEALAKIDAQAQTDAKAEPTDEALAKIDAQAQTDAKAKGTAKHEVPAKNSALTPKGVKAKPTLPMDRESRIAERLARIADDSDAATPGKPIKQVPLSVIAEREKRLQREEEVIIQRQMRIIDDLMEE